MVEHGGALTDRVLIFAPLVTIQGLLVLAHRRESLDRQRAAHLRKYQLPCRFVPSTSVPEVFELREAMRDPLTEVDLLRGSAKTFELLLQQIGCRMIVPHPRHQNGLRFVCQGTRRGATLT